MSTDRMTGVPGPKTKPEAPAPISQPPTADKKARQKLPVLKAMERIVSYLNDMTPAQRKRVLAYVNAEVGEAADPLLQQQEMGRQP